MVGLIFTAVLAFTGTNIDDILVLTLLYAGASGRSGRLRIGAGYFLGVLTLTAVSALAASGLRMIPGGWLRWLGLVPVAMGVRAFFGDDSASARASSLLGAMLVTLGNGADNLGVYIALFGSLTAAQTALSSIIFLLMAFVFAFAAARLAAFPALGRFIERHGAWLTPMVLILLGLYILFL